MVNGILLEYDKIAKQKKNRIKLGVKFYGFYLNKEKDTRQKKEIKKERERERKQKKTT